MQTKIQRNHSHLILWLTAVLLHLVGVRRISQDVLRTCSVIAVSCGTTLYAHSAVTCPQHISPCTRLLTEYVELQANIGNGIVYSSLVTRATPDCVE